MIYRDESRKRFDFAVLALVFAVMFFFALGRAPLGNPDEGRYAEIPREMVASGDWITPRLNGVAYFEKPPLTYWCVATSLSIFGPQEWALRATAAVFSIGGVLLAYIVARCVFDRGAGLAAGVVLGTSFFYFAMGRLLLLDSVVSVLMSATLGCFILGVRETAGRRRRWLFYGLYLSAALATLAKGLIGFLIPGAVMFLWLLIFNQWRRLRPLYLPSGFLLFLAVAAPWHVLAALRNPTWAHFYFVHEHWERFTTTEHGRFRPWWFFLPFVVFGTFPWFGFLPKALRATLAGGWVARKKNADAWFFIVWVVFILLFFSASKSKLAPYVLPVFPPLSILLGVGLSRSGDAGRPGGNNAGIFSYVAVSLALAAALVFAIAEPAVVRIASNQAEALRPAVIALIAILVFGAAGALVLRKVRGDRMVLVSIATAAAAFLMVLGFATRDIQPVGTKELALYVKKHVPATTPVFHYHDFFHDFTFYAERFVGTVEFHGDELELVNDEAARRSGRFLGEDEFWRRWQGAGRVFVVVREKKLLEARLAFAKALKRQSLALSPIPVQLDLNHRFYVVRTTDDYLLLSNRED